MKKITPDFANKRILRKRGQKMKRRAENSTAKPKETSSQRRPLVNHDHDSDASDDGGTWDENLPYGGKVIVARRQKRGIASIRQFIQVFIGVTLLFAVIYMAVFLEYFVFHIHYAYAKLGHAEAQHKIAQSFLEGNGVRQDRQEAMKWFQQASDNGHVEAGYNLAVGHIKGHHKLPMGQSQRLLEKAAMEGLREAAHVLKHVCLKGKCS